MFFFLLFSTNVGKEKLIHCVRSTKKNIFDDSFNIQFRWKSDINTYEYITNDK